MMIEKEELNGIAVLRLAHGKASALDLELLEALESALGALATDSTRAVILTGSGSIFSAGVDLLRLTKEGGDYVDRFLDALDRTFRALFTLPLPVVAALNGHAIAGGCILAQACDYRIMAQGKGRIGVAELLVGVQFPTLALEIMRFVVPSQHLQRIVYSGASFLPDEALQLGLLDEVVAAEQLGERSGMLATQLAAVPAPVFAATKSHLRRETLERVERWSPSIDPAMRAIWRDPRSHAGITAYLERTLGRK